MLSAGGKPLKADNCSLFPQILSFLSVSAFLTCKNANVVELVV